MDRFDYINLKIKYENLQAKYRILKDNHKDFFDYMNNNFPDEVASYFLKDKKEGK